MGDPVDIRPLDAPSRLAQILHNGRIRANPTFGTEGRAIVAFTESSQASVLRLIRDGRYTPWGIGFSKQFVFDQDGVWVPKSPVRPGLAGAGRWGLGC
jgi:hypothetical protein